MVPPPSNTSGNNRLFGQTMKKQQRPTSSYQRQFGGGGYKNSNTNDNNNNTTTSKNQNENYLVTQQKLEYKRMKILKGEEVDSIFGVERFTNLQQQQQQHESSHTQTSTTATTMSKNKSSSSSNQQHQQQKRRGWLYNMLPTTVITSNQNDISSSVSSGPERSGLDLYFCTESTGQKHNPNFKSTILYRPYFYILPDLSSLSSSLQYNDSSVHGQQQSNNNNNSIGNNLIFGNQNHTDESSSSTPTLDALMELLITTLNRTIDNELFYNIEVVHRIDLDETNHLSPQKNRRQQKNQQQEQGGRVMLKIIFDNVTQLREVRNIIQDMIAKNKQRGPLVTLNSYTTTTASSNDGNMTITSSSSSSIDDIISREPLRLLTDMREYDVPYVVRVCTDLDIRAGTWYTVNLESHHLPSHNNHTNNTNNSNNQDSSNSDNNNAYKISDYQKYDNGGISLTEPDRELRAEPVFLAFDIECTKAPLKFPTAEIDEIFMISFMVSTPDGKSNGSGGGSTGGGGQGYLIVSRSVVSQDVHDFEYTPKPNLPGPFHIYNEENEKKLLERFFFEFRKHQPQIVVTYNGDFFDWPFVEQRAKFHGINMYNEVGIEHTGEAYTGRSCVHLDAFHWVQRDSYLPQGSQGLKAVTKYKLKYDPVEVDPEDMIKFAKEKPVHMATYSVSDAVATYYLYEKYVHLFIFSLCTIIPMGPEDVICKGSGTLCESLLLVQACSKSIICPNKQIESTTSFHHGHLLESETYIGGKVECLETGVYRSDIEYEFNLQSSAFQQLLDHLDRDLQFAIEVEGNKKRIDIVNYEKVRSEIASKLEQLRDQPKRYEKPYVYHLDVGAMYPNIILTNRLQPSSIVNDAICAACDFNQVKNNCKRRMDWVWRGDYSPASHAEYERTKDQLSTETLEDGRAFNQLPEREQAKLIQARLKIYANKAYKKTKITEEQTRTDIVCMRENDFYVGTVRQFRDRRYEYKALNKSWNRRVSEATDPATKKMCEDKVLIYDSLQIAHKCILNSFYGYVMRKGARWRSMEMAGIVTKTGSDIITQARILVEQIGRPLELDTDGIWCILPGSFPDVYIFEASDGSKLKLEYPCVMLNADLHDKFSNDQYQTLVDPVNGIYETHRECSIFFEVDGPYRCMVLPASTEEGKLLKKRYAVFNFDGSLAELKGFELKRRGELELIKTFQSQVFERFLEGSTLEECYDAVAQVANHWIDVIDTRGDSLEEEELVDLISENRNMSRQLDDYGEQKGTSQTTARRLSEFLGAEIIKDKGLNCKFIIAEQPYGAPVTERAIPTAIWKAEPFVMKHYLRKWLKAPGLEGDGFDIRNVLDWDYYFDRLAKTIQKIITIPAALQKVQNPVPRIEHPAWLHTKITQLSDRLQQKSIKSMFESSKAMVEPTKKDARDVVDIEEYHGGARNPSKRPIVHKMIRKAVPTPVEVIDLEVTQPRVELSKDSFPTWLKQKKSSWKNLRSQKNRITRNGDNNHFDDKPQKKAKSIEAIARDAVLSLSQKEWQIVEVREMSSFDSSQPAISYGSGEFIVWAMIGNDSLQKINVSVPRILYISTKREMKSVSDDILYLRLVDKHLPQNKASLFLYELALPEHVYKSKKWTEYIRPVQPSDEIEVGFESVYESSTPLLTRLLTEMGSVCKLKPTATRTKNKSYQLSDLTRVSRATEGDYLCKTISYQRTFLYTRIHPKLKTGIVAVFHLDGGSGVYNKLDKTNDICRPSACAEKSFIVSATCRIWVVKPNSRNSQRGIALKQCETILSELLDTIQESAGHDSDYNCVSPASNVKMAGLNFVDTEELAYAGANESISTYSKTNPGAMIILVNSSKPSHAIRRHMSTFSSFPVLSMAFPPGPAHNPSVSTLPSLNWEQPAVQLGLEAFLHMVVVSYPKRVSYARYGHVPLGNLGDDENRILFDVCLSRLIQKNRALSWASLTPGRPDVGVDFVPSLNGGTFPLMEAGSFLCDQGEIWGEDDELVSPVIRRPGCYRTICVDVDVQDIAIAALTSNQAVATSGFATVMQQSVTNPTSPNCVSSLGNGFSMAKTNNGPLGDELATSISLPIVRALVGGWLKDAYSSNSFVADELLHHVYRLLSNPDTLLYDPALHRAVHALMKSTFLSLISELQRLGCSIVFASFHKVIIATNKLELADAEEYINFVLDTARRQASDNIQNGDALSKLSLRPRQFHSNFAFLDEYNFGSMHLERVQKEEIDEATVDLIIPDSQNSNCFVVPSVVTAWSMMNYLGSEVAQEYFRAIIGKFSKDVFKKQMSPIIRGQTVSLTSSCGNEHEIISYKKMMISKHFANYLTRAVGEIMADGFDENFSPPLSYHSRTRVHPALEFVKNVMKVLELDSDMEGEVQILKRSLFAQIGIAEYSKLAQWVHPCPKFILPDVFCVECYDSRDLNLCHIPPRESDEEMNKSWVCEDCGTPYNSQHIEDRLIQLLQRKMVRYHLQDLRCSKTNRVATRVLSALSESSIGLKLDIPNADATMDLYLLRSIATFHDLEILRETIDNVLMSFR